MEAIVVVCGTWNLDKNKWMFSVDPSKGCKILRANAKTRYDDVIRIIHEDYGVEKQLHEIVLSYMLPKKRLMKLPRDTPPVFVTSSRQFHEFFQKLKSDPMRLCVEIHVKENVISGQQGGDYGFGGVSSGKRDREESHDDSELEEIVDEDEFGSVGQKDEEDEDEQFRFDYCDDSDGATSDDEDLSLFGRLPHEDEKKPTVPVSEKATTTKLKDSNRVQMDLDSLTIAVGQKYKTKDDLETRLKILSALQHFDFNVAYSESDRYMVHCWVQGCSWRLRATPIGDSTEFCVRIFVDEHTCSITERSARSRQATVEILGAVYKDYVGGVGPTIKPKAVADALRMRFGIEMEYWKARRVLIAARNLVLGTPEHGYAELPAYLYNIRKANPGTLTRLVVDEAQRFKYVFLAFGASLSGFPYCRKVVVVDGTFLQGKYKGTLLTASSQDGNFQIFPLAFGVVDTENDESWEWFFRQLCIVIPDDAGLAIISDRHRSIGNAIAKVYPLASRGICTYHLYKNILVRFKGGDAFRLVKKAANAYRLTDFETIFGQIEALNPALHSYLQRADLRIWTRVHFPGNRYNITTTNIAESLNRVLSGSRSLPVVCLLEEIRLIMTRWFFDRQQDALDTKTRLTRGVEKLLEVRVNQAKLLTVQQLDAHQFQVTRESSCHIVNLTEKRCSCRRFDLEMLPCVHAIAAAVKAKVSRISLSHPYYRSSYLRNTYPGSIMPKNTEEDVPEQVANLVVLPPLVRQPPGRPKNGRIKSALEKTMDKKRPRKQSACSTCNQVGHNCKTCKTDV